MQAVFCLTNFWEHLFGGLSAEEAGAREAEQAYNVAVAASKTKTLEHYLFSTLPHASALTDGKRPVPRESPLFYFNAERRLTSNL